MARIYSPAWIDGREALRGPFIVQPATFLLGLALLVRILCRYSTSRYCVGIARVGIV